MSNPSTEPPAAQTLHLWLEKAAQSRATRTMRPARPVTALLTALPLALPALLQSRAAPAAAAAISIVGVGGSASASGWKRQPCAANVPGNDADIVTFAAIPVPFPAESCAAAA